MTDPELEIIPIILTTTMGTQSWDVSLPTNIVVQAIITKLLATQDLPFREQDDTGRRVPYRLMWREGERFLGEAETLAQANVRPQHTLVMTHQARAGHFNG